MGVVITESDMQFGEYDEGQVFWLEKSRQYTKNLMSNGIKSCEFILLRGNKLYFVEAKSSCPKQLEARTSVEKREKYEKDVQDIAAKMIHSLTLYANILLNRYDAEGLPEMLLDRDLSSVEICLVLVVKNKIGDELVPFQDVLRKHLQKELRLWKIRTFSVIDEQTARKKRFVI